MLLKKFTERERGRYMRGFVFKSCILRDRSLSGNVGDRELEAPPLLIKRNIVEIEAVAVLYTAQTKFV